MKIEKVTPLYYNYKAIQKYDNKLKAESGHSDYTYNPFAYKDYNINFTARLFRTPANFFEQEFNRNGMPDTMKTYLFDDYEDRQNMPPAQMMKLVFDDMNEAKSLEQVKHIYSDEPLFNKLNDEPNRKTRTGVIAEIDLMKQPDKSLFKNGNDNLGLYILKKIYLEGKTLKEINKDFEKDISVHYKGLSPIKYETLSAYGIKFPNSAFWKSFIATREDFPYEYKPRKVAVQRTVLNTDNAIRSKKEIEKKKFDSVKDWEIDKLADGLIKGIGSEEETGKQLKKHNVKNKEASNFVAKYMSEINSIVLEKVHASEEMKDFYANYDNLSSSQKSIFKAYWNSDPLIKQQRSEAMKDTIKLFMDSYGADGNNEEFQDLLNYARSIKPRRMEEQKEHDKIQAEYDEMFANFEVKPESKVTGVFEDVLEPVEDVSAASIPPDKDDIEKAPSISYVVSPLKHEIRLNGDLSDTFNKLMMSQLLLLPETFAKRYMKYFLAHPTINDKYKLSMLIQGNVPEGYEDLVYAKKELDNISLGVNKDFTLKYPYIIAACNQAMVELIFDVKQEEVPKMLELNTDELIRLIEKSGIRELTPEQKSKLDMMYHDYLKPITSKQDINKITDMLINFISNYDGNIVYGNSSDMNALIKLISANIQSNNALKRNLSKIIKSSKFIESYGGTAKILLKNDVSDETKKAKMELMFADLLSVSADKMTDILLDNRRNLRTILKPAAPEIYNILEAKSYMKDLSANVDDLINDLKSLM